MTVAPATPLSRYPARVIAQERPLRSERADEEPRRWAWMDNLRVAVIAGVIVEHVATAYVLDIDWYYEERSASAVTEAIVGAAILPAALFAMAVLFLVAGCSVHGRWRARVRGLSFATGSCVWGHRSSPLPW